MTDRGRSALRQSPQTFTVGPSKLTWKGTRLEIDVDERGAAPQFGRLQGKITLYPSALSTVELPLTTDGAHVWRPFAPVADVTVSLGKGGEWEGHGYFDANFGTRALEQDFAYWTWGRYPTSDGAACFYDATRLDGSELAQAVHFDRSGKAEPMDLPPKARLTRSLWAVRRETRADAGYRPRQALAMLDAPFYNRAAIRTQLDGKETVGVFEALDLTRFRSPLLKPMLAVRVPRRRKWRFLD